MARDPKRIEILLEMLKQAWLLSPDLRLGQFLRGACTGYPEMFTHQEDEEWAESFCKILSRAELASKGTETPTSDQDEMTIEGLNRIVENATGLSADALRIIPFDQVRDMTDRWVAASPTRRREIVAEMVNRQPPQNGQERWKCEQCGYEWLEPVDPDYDRTKDRTNWPVGCGGGAKCLNKKASSKLS